MFGMARRCLESGKPRRKCYMKEWSRGKRKELVVGIDKEFGEVVPPAFRVQFLFQSEYSSMTVTVRLLTLYS